jgi:hypothetical protein
LTALTVGLALLLQACAAGSPQPAPPQAAFDAEGGETDPEALEAFVGALPPQRLEPGTCGRFLWAKSADPQLIYFEDEKEGEARMKLGERVVDLPRSRVTGAQAYGFYETVALQGERTRVQVNTELSLRAGLVDGALIRRGSVKLETMDGWSYVVPVAGLIACR